MDLYTTYQLFDILISADERADRHHTETYVHLLSHFLTDATSGKSHSLWHPRSLTELSTSATNWQENRETGTQRSSHMSCSAHHYLTQHISIAADVVWGQPWSVLQLLFHAVQHTDSRREQMLFMAEWRSRRLSDSQLYRCLDCWCFYWSSLGFSLKTSNRK